MHSVASKPLLTKEQLMKNKVFLISLLIASSSVLAEQGVLESAGKQVLKDAATSAAPKEAVEGVEAAGQTLDKAKDIKGAVETAPTAVKSQAEGAVKEAVKAKVDTATSVVPKEAVGDVDATGQTLEKAKDIKGAVGTAPAAAQDQAETAVKEAVKAKVDEATPAEVKKATEAVKKGKKLAKKLKVPKSTGEATQAIEGQAKEKAAEKALELVK